MSHETDSNAGRTAETHDWRRTSGRLARLCLKELRDILRDRRTVVTLVLMPLLVYPLLSILFQKTISSSRSAAGQVICVVGLDSEQEARRFQEYIALGDQVLRQRQQDLQPRPVTPAPQPPNEETLPPQEVLIRWVTGLDLEQKVADGEVDVAVRLREVAYPDRARTVQVELSFRETSALSQKGLEFLEDRVHAFNEEYLLERLRMRRAPARVPMVLASRSIRDARPAVSLTTLIPLILILMTITGAVYPAIDLTAGERERGTLEALMAAPVPRLGLLIAKYFAVVAVALLTAMANLLAMSVTLFSTGLGPMVFGQGGLSASLVAQVLGLLVLFAAFFSGILLAITSFARSFKEAQAYLIPLMLFSLAPGLMSLMPELKFSGVLSVVPLVNIVLLARDLMEGQVNGTLATIAVLSTLLYALAAIALAARIFGTDAILYGSEASWSDLLFRPRQSRSSSSASAAMLCLAALFPIYFLVANWLALSPGLAAGNRLIAAALTTAALFVLLPLLFVIVQGVKLREAFQLAPAKWTAFLAAAILGLTVWPLAHEVFLLNKLLGLNPLTAERVEATEKLLASWRSLSPLLILASLGVAPAMCEELFFRGYLFSALRRKLSPWKTILVTALLFGSFHVVVSSLLAVERFLPSTFLGLILGWVCWRTGSVLPGMLLHACHNGLLLLLACYRDALAKWNWNVSEQSHLPVSWLIASLIGATVAGALLGRLPREAQAPPGSSETAPDRPPAESA